MKSEGSSKVIGETKWVSFGELIEPIIPSLGKAHLDGWDKWGGENERPRNYNARLAEADLLSRLYGMVQHGVMVACMNPSNDELQAIFREAQAHSTFSSQLQSWFLKARGLTPGTGRQITREWKVSAIDAERVCAHLVSMIHVQGRYDAAAEWKQSEGRLTPIEVAERRKMKRDSAEAYVLAANLAKAAWAGEIRAFAPGQRLRRVYTPEEIQGSPLNFADEFYPNDLDEWFKKNEPRNKFIFDPPMDATMVKLVNSLNRLVERGKKASQQNVADEAGFGLDLVRRRWTEFKRRTRLSETL